VGTRSYGKGSIQGIFPLEVGGIGMRLTTAKFYSPNGHPYSGVGVEPHLTVHAVARPVDGVALTGAPTVGGEAQAPDQCLDTAIEVARRSTTRPVVRAQQRSTASR